MSLLIIEDSCLNFYRDGDSPDISQSTEYILPKCMKIRFIYSRLKLLIKHHLFSRDCCARYTTVDQRKNPFLHGDFIFLTDIVSVYIKVTNLRGICQLFREEGNFLFIAVSTRMQVKDLI